MIETMIIHRKNQLSCPKYILNNGLDGNERLHRNTLDLCQNSLVDHFDLIRDIKQCF